MNNATEERKEIPLIEIKNDELIIKLPLKELIFTIENRGDAEYKVAKPKKILEALKFQLQNYAESNATELGISEFQYLLDRCADAIYEDATDIIISSED